MEFETLPHRWLLRMRLAEQWKFLGTRTHRLVAVATGGRVGGINVRYQADASQFPGWFYDIDRTLRDGRLDYLFIGSSRVAAAIDIDAFQDQLKLLEGRETSADTLARGNISLVHTVLALERLSVEHPGRLAGTVLLFEIPGGLPPVFGTWNGTARGWDTAWAEVGKNPQLLARVLDGPQLARFWRSPTTFEAKSSVTIRWAMKGFAFFDEQERVREQFFSAGDKLTRKVVGPRGQGRRLDLSDQGGIRTDSDAAQQIKTAVVEEGESPAARHAALRRLESVTPAQSRSYCKA